MKLLAALCAPVLLCCQCSVAYAASRSVTLSVPGMTCPTCPITVKKALTRVDGVTHAEVSYEKREAKVTFDDSRTGVQTLLKASANAGYPASTKE